MAYLINNLFISIMLRRKNPYRKKSRKELEKKAPVNAKETTFPAKRGKPLNSGKIAVPEKIGIRLKELNYLGLQ